MRLNRRTFLVSAGACAIKGTTINAQEIPPAEMERKNAEVRLFQAETRANLARVMVERFLLPIDAWILTGGPGKAIPNIDDINNKRAKDVAPWFLLLIETKPRASATPLEYRFALDTARRKMQSWCEEGSEHGDDHGCKFLETLQSYAGRIRESLLTYMVDDLARAVLPQFYGERDKMDSAGRIDLDITIANRRRLLHEGEGHLYWLTDERTPLERAAIKDNLLY